MDDNKNSPTHTINPTEIASPGANTEVVKTEKPVKNSIYAINRRRQGKLSIEEQMAVVQQSHAGVSHSQIAKTFLVSQQAISQTLHRWKALLQTLGNVEVFESNKDQILSATQLMLIENLHKPKYLNKANYQSLAVAFDKVSNHLRLERGQSTSISQNLSLSFNVSEFKSPNKSDT